MGSIVDGQPVDAAITNGAKLDRVTDDTAIGIISLANPTSTTITDTQGTINVILGGIGGNQSTPATGYSPVPSNTISASQTHEAALRSLAGKYYGATASGGHYHSGVDGQGAQIAFGNLSGTQLIGYEVAATDLTGVVGASSDVSTPLSGQTASTASTIQGIAVNNPYNYIHMYDADYDNYLDGTGNKVYGRLTNASTAWALNYYSNISGTETSYSMPASSYVKWFYQKLFTEENRPVYSDAVVIQSDQIAGEIPNATTSLKGKVQLGTTSVSIAAANSGGTANATVANADHTHQGIHSLAPSGGTALYNDVTFTGTGSVTVTQSGQNIQIAGAASGSAVNSIAASGSTPLTGAVTLSASGGAIITQSGQNIQVYAASGTIARTLTTSSATGANAYTLSLTDGQSYGNNPLLVFTSAAAATVTVPTHGSVAFPVGEQVDVASYGAGDITFAGASTVTVNSLSGNKTINGQYVGVSIMQITQNNWLLLGNLKA